MTINIIGSLKNSFGFKSKVEIDVDKEISSGELLKAMDLEGEKGHMFGFFLVNGKKIERDNKDFIIKSDDKVKVFSKTFGG